MGIDSKGDKQIDLAAIRARLAASDSKRFWQSLDELAETQEYKNFLHNEFPYDPAQEKEADGYSRRDVLKLMAASAALAGLTGCTRLPTEKIVPYVHQPAEIIPGKALFYATSFPLGGAAAGLLVESHMGRPTKVEGNPEHPGSLGATDPFAQASMLSMYDPDRSQTVIRDGRVSNWAAFVNAAEDLRVDFLAKKGAGFHILTEPVISPTLGDQIHALLAELPQAKWHRWEPCGRDGALEGARLAFGSDVNTVYRFDQADVIVSLDADFLCAGPGHVRHAHDFAARRRISGPQSNMSRLYVVECTPSNTGSMADHRLRMQASRVEGFARALASAVGAASAGTASPPGVPNDWIPALARDLQQHRGASIIVAGDQQPPVVHALAHAMNAQLGNVGKTVIYTDPLEAEPVNQMESLRELVSELASGRVDVLLIVGANPVFTAPADLNFPQELLKAKQRVHMGMYFDETAILCNWHIPEAHFLEAWSDARTYDGTAGIMQPLIAPLYQGRSAHEMFAVLQGHAERSGHDIVHDYWKSRSTVQDFEPFWLKSLHDGWVAGTALPEKKVALRSGWEASATPTQPGTGLEVVFRPDPTIGDGRWANSGWLQELPKPFTRLTWDNVALFSPATAQRFGVGQGDMVTFSLGGRQVQSPVWIQPGQADDSVTLHLGYGRERAGQVGTGKGFNTYPLRTSAAPWMAFGLEVRKSGKTYPLASVQHQYIIAAPEQEGQEEDLEAVSAFRRDLIRVATLDEFRKNPNFAKEPEKNINQGLSLYPGYNYKTGYAWAMSIDLTSCMGCSACVVACQSENNIAVVGKEETMRGRAMHWIRVDTYYQGGVESPDVYREVVPCQQCENAPCEVVCPVGATLHSTEGLNQMVYNRCVGTRYCSNNCPYKVRRFNFKLYSDWTTASLYGMRNPNVTVRSRGVMEKCTYCVQRINAAKIRAEEENRTVRDGEILTACQQVCPTQAIVFGDQNDPKSRVSQLKAQSRDYSLLADLNVRPRTTYLARLRNPNPEIQG
jgi:MoCo/4Fe-4S cofactor protein with predicted Tat translocation signal